jgi:hypothetical protein
MAMEEALDMPNIFFTMSAADLQRPELQDLMIHFKPNLKEGKTSERVKALSENPHSTDWFFLYRGENFLTYFFENLLDVKSYWATIEYGYREPAHTHSIAWMTNVPDVNAISTEWARLQMPADESGDPNGPGDIGSPEEEAQRVYKFADAVVSIWNPVFDGNRQGDLPQPETHPCRKRYKDVEDDKRKYADLIYPPYNVHGTFEYCRI